MTTLCAGHRDFDGVRKRACSLCRRTRYGARARGRNAHPGGAVPSFRARADRGRQKGTAMGPRWARGRNRRQRSPLVVPPRERRAAEADRAAEPPSAKPPTKRSVAEPLFRAVWARVATLHQRHGCAMPAHCAEHTRLVHDQTGVAIDAPALVARASRAWLDLGRADGRLPAWLDKTVAAFTQIQAHLGALVRTVPADVNLPETRDSLVRHLCECLDTIECYGLYFSGCTDRGPFPSTSVDRPPSPDDLAGAAQY